MASCTNRGQALGEAGACHRCGAAPSAPAGVFGIFLGGLGVHKFVLGYTGAGVIMLVIGLFTCGIASSIIGLIEGIIYLTKSDEEFDRALPAAVPGPSSPSPVSMW